MFKTCWYRVRFGFRISDFGFVSDFGFRISDFEFFLPPHPLN